MNKFQRTVLVLGALGMAVCGMRVAYYTKSGMDWGSIGCAPYGARSIDPMPTIVSVLSVGAATASMFFATKSRKG